MEKKIQVCNSRAKYPHETYEVGQTVIKKTDKKVEYRYCRRHYKRVVWEDPEGNPWVYQDGQYNRLYEVKNGGGGWFMPYACGEFGNEIKEQKNY